MNHFKFIIYRILSEFVTFVEGISYSMLKFRPTCDIFKGNLFLFVEIRLKFSGVASTQVSLYSKPWRINNSRL